MIASDIVPITFLVPQFIAGIFFLRIFHGALLLYRRKVNPDYPILPNEAAFYFNKNPLGYILKMPIMPFLTWKILFEKNKDPELDCSIQKAKNSFLTLLMVMFSTFFLHFLALYFRLI